MKTIDLLIIPAFLLSLISYGQNTRELLEENKVKHITITHWDKKKDGTEKRSGDMKRIEQYYDSNGNLIKIILFMTFRETKQERTTYSYDDKNRLTEIILSKFNDNNPEGYLVEKQIRRYDIRDNVIYYSLYKGSDANPKAECEYSFQYDENEKMVEKLSKCNSSRGVQEESVKYKYDKKGNLVLEDFSISSDTKYELKYYKKSSQVQERMRYGGASTRVEFFDEEGNLIKVDGGGKITWYSYDDKQNITEQIERSQSSITGPVYYSLVYDVENRLIEKTGKLKSGTVESIEKWIYHVNGLLAEHIENSDSEKYEYEYY